MERDRRLICILALAVAYSLGCAQMVRIEVMPGGESFVVDQAKGGMDRRYDGGGRKTEFASGTRVPIDKVGLPKIRVINRAGATVWEEQMVGYPMRWYETALVPVFGIGYMMFAPYSDPYVIRMDKGDIVLKTAQEIATEIVAALPATVKIVGFPYIESTEAERGKPYVSEGNRKLSEYVAAAIRAESQERDFREYKYGIDYYLRHTSSGLGAAVAARRELFAKFAADERLDAIVYGRNDVHRQKISGGGPGRQQGRAILTCRIEFDILDGKTGGTLGCVKYSMALGAENSEMIQEFVPPQAMQLEEAPTIEVALERAAQRLSRDILENIANGDLLEAYEKPVATHVSDLGYLVSTSDDQRKTQPNMYGAYLSEKVSGSLLETSRGRLVIVSPNRPQKEEAAEAGKRLPAKVVFCGEMVKIGADLNIVLMLRDIEQGATLTRVEYTLPLNPALDEQLRLGNQD